MKCHRGVPCVFDVTYMFKDAPSEFSDGFAHIDQGAGAACHVYDATAATIMKVSRVISYASRGALEFFSHLYVLASLTLATAVCTHHFSFQPATLSYWW